jgi:hypothetical protein
VNERLQQFEQKEARTWVEAHNGSWDHVQWLLLLGELRRGGWVDLDPDSVGRVLERKKREYRNLRLWRDSGEAWRWIAARKGEWVRHEWLTLLAGLQCWLGPIDPAALDEALQKLRRIYVDWQRWLNTGAAARWVERRQGEWGHDDWLRLLGEVRSAGFGSLPADLIGLTLEECKRAYWNLRRWEESGEPYRWVEAHRGRWTADDLRRLGASLERSAFAPLDGPSIEAALLRARQRYEALREWLYSGEALAWVFTRRGEWTHDDWLDLLAHFDGEVERDALREALESLREQYAGLHRWLDRRSANEERLMLDAPAAPIRRAA